MALLYRALMYCQMMAGRQRTDENRRSYSAAAIILRKAQDDISRKASK